MKKIRVFPPPWQTDLVNLPFPKEGERPEWPWIWMQFAHLVSHRSCDPKYKVGVVIVAEDNTQVLSLGYNGNYRSGPNVRDSLETGKGGFIHGEVNCLIKCDFSFPKKKILYTTVSPCTDCSKLIVNACVSRVVYDKLYEPDTRGLEIMRSVGIEVMSLQEALASILTTRT